MAAATDRPSTAGRRSCDTRRSGTGATCRSRDTLRSGGAPVADDVRCSEDTFLTGESRGAERSVLSGRGRDGTEVLLSLLLRGGTGEAVLARSWLRRSKRSRPSRT